MQTFATHEERINVGVSGTTSHNALNSAKHGKMTVFVKSKRMLVTTKIVTLPQSFNGLVPAFTSGAKRLPIYENVLDEDQKAVVENSVELAKGLGIELEVKDIAMTSVFARFMELLRGSKTPPKIPSVSFEGSVITMIRGQPDLIGKDARKKGEEHAIPV